MKTKKEIKRALMSDTALIAAIFRGILKSRKYSPEIQAKITAVLKERKQK